MIDLKSCPECGVPDFISNEQLWLNNGDIVQARQQSHRILFIESENLSPLFQGIEEIIGESIESIIITSMREAVRYFLQQFVPKEVRELVLQRRIDPRPLGTVTADMAKMAVLATMKL